MSDRSLTAETRQRTGSGVLKQMRREGYIPCVVYGGEKENQNLKIPNKAFNDMLKDAPSSNILIDLDLDGASQQVFIQDIQFDDLKQQIIHADFLAVDDKTELKAEIPVTLTGEPEGVKMGGLLDQMLYTIPLKCLPKDLPETLSADVAHLQVSEMLSIGEMEFPDGVKPQLNEKVVVAMVSKTRVAQSTGDLEEGEEGAEEGTEDSGEEGDAPAEGGE